MEQVNTENTFHGSLHYGGASTCCANCVTDTYYPGNSVADGSVYHVHSMTWSPQYIAFMTDGVEFYRWLIWAGLGFSQAVVIPPGERRSGRGQF